jgi:hypothetical protein
MGHYLGHILDTVKLAMHSTAALELRMRRCCVDCYVVLKVFHKLQYWDSRVILQAQATSPAVEPAVVETVARTAQCYNTHYPATE